MTQDVRQWLAEIRTLQQKLTEAHQERDEAYTGAANWRKLYETEAQQRRTEANLSRRAIADLKAELQELQNSVQPMPLPAKDDKASQMSELRRQVAHLDVSQLQEKLAETLLECDRLTQALKVEQEKHSQTRKALTTALGDTVDMLTRERAGRTNHGEPAPLISGAGLTGLDSAKLDSAKTPSLELPPVSQAQSLV